jgi:hypothetical protein
MAYLMKEARTDAGKTRDTRSEDTRSEDTE